MQAGDLIDDRYQLIERQHSSWLAFDQVRGSRCVLKPADGFVDPDVAAWLGKVWHAGLPHLVDRLDRICMDDDLSDPQPGHDPIHSFFVFEYLPGLPLCELAAQNGGKIPLLQLLPLAGQAAGILAYLHQQDEVPVLHLDIKPEHLLLGVNGQISLIDFGSARFHGGADKNSRRPVALTPDYAAPELLAGHPAPASDVYSLGLSLLHLLTGQPAAVCRSQPLQLLLPDAAPSLLGLFQRCLHADLNLRMADACEMLNSLANIQITPGTPGIQGTLDTSDSPATPGIQGTPGAQGIQGTLNDWISSRDRHETAAAAGTAGLTSVTDNCLAADQIRPDADIHDDLQEPPQMSARNSYAPLVCIWGNPEFGCEMAGVLADSMEVLVIDADLLNPQADLLLGCDESWEKQRKNTPFLGLDQAFSEDQRGNLDLVTLKGFFQKTCFKQVNLLGTRVSLEHYDAFALDSLNQILHLARMGSDLVVILCSRFIYDAFTCYCLLTANHVIIPRAGDSGSFRECRRALSVMTGRFQMDLSRAYVAAFPYDRQLDLSQGTLDELCEGRLIGCVSAKPGRRSMKTGAVPYAAALDRNNRHEYLAIIRRLPALSGLRKPGSKGRTMKACRL